MNRELGPLLGQRAIPRSSDGYSFGSANAEGRTVNLSLWRFSDPLETIPEIIKWLEAEGATGIKYDLGSARRD